MLSPLRLPSRARTGLALSLALAGCASDPIREEPACHPYTDTETGSEMWEVDVCPVGEYLACEVSPGEFCAHWFRGLCSAREIPYPGHCPDASNCEPVCVVGIAVDVGVWIPGRPVCADSDFVLSLPECARESGSEKLPE